MEFQSQSAVPTPPSAADYQALVDRVTSAMISREARQIDASTFRLRIDEINEESRTLDLLHKLHNMRQRLAAQEAKSSASPLKLP